MEAKYFMVGDYVLNNEGIAFRVAQVNDACYSEHTSDLMLENGEEYKEVDAIEITVEILEKNGFKHRIIDCAEFYYIAEDYYDITISEWSDSIWLVRFDCTEMNTPHEQKICGYVHQLQHFLKECGLTELADNFKV